MKYLEKYPLAKTVRMAQKLLKIEAALWTFVALEGIEPTNNLAEQALRSAVIWRRTSFGSQSQAGSEFVSRILTVLTSLKAQQQNPLDYLTEACLAKRLIKKVGGGYVFYHRMLMEHFANMKLDKSTMTK